MSSRQLVFSDGSSDKFWNIELDGSSHTVNYGRTGTSGQTKTKECANEDEAQKSFDKLVEQKLKKGYTDAGGSRVAAKKKKAAAKKKTAGGSAAKKATSKKAPAKKTAVKSTGAAKKSRAKKKPAESPIAVRLVFEDSKSTKFWAISLDGASHTVNYGRQGTGGQTRTKDFESNDSARASFEKLVAEKRKKGYTDDADGATAAKPEKSKAGGKASQSAPVVEVDLKITQNIDLAPNDWSIASFRKREIIKRPAPPVADLDAAFEQLCKLRPTIYGWELPFEKINFPSILPREEAHFWLCAMTFNRGRLEGKNALPNFLGKLRKAHKFTGKISVSTATRLMKANERGFPPEVMVALFSLFSAEECLEMALALVPKKSKQHGYDIAGQIQTIVHGLQAFVVPYVSVKELTAMQKTVRKTLNIAATPPGDYDSFPAEHYLAAVLGMHKDVEKIVSGWDDDLYRSKEDWCDYYQRPQTILFGLPSADAVESEWRRLGVKLRGATDARGFLACTEYSALDILANNVCDKSNKDECAELLKVLTLVRAPEAAEPILQCRLSSKTPAIARDWMDKYVGNAVAGLIEPAGNRGKHGDAAIDYLRSVKRDGHEALIAKCVKKAGRKSSGAARIQKDVLDYVEKVYKPMDGKTTPRWLKTELEDVDLRKTVKLPAWATPANLPALTVGDSKLNDDQLITVLQVIAATPVPDKHPLLESIRENADKQARDEFAWKMFELWQEDGANSKHKWAMGTIGHLGGDQCVLKLTPLVRAWPGESQHARAVFGLQCLRGVGTSVALMQLSGIAQKLKFKGLKTKAAVFVDEIAKERGMSRAELEDRVIPDCGLDEMGRREISFGTRSFSFVLSGDLKPMVRDENGKVRPNPPKPAAKDDETIANASLAEWKVIKKQIKDVAVLQSSRLEQGMVTGRRWPVDDFESLLVKHPLMTHLVQKIIWGAFDKKDKRIALFRVTEERDYADAKDEAASLAKAHSIGIVHPLDMKDAERAAWGEVLSDYELIAPFPQLGRDVYSLEKGEEKKNDLERYHGLNLAAPTMVFTLEKLGWIRGEAMDAGCFDEHSKQFQAADVTAVVGYEGHVGMGWIDPDELLTTETIHFCAGMREPSGYGWNSKKRMKLGQVPEIVLSEVIADLNVLKSKAK